MDDTGSLSEAPLLPQQQQQQRRLPEEDIPSAAMAEELSPAVPEVVVGATSEAALESPVQGKKGKPKPINLRVYTLKEETSKNIKFESGRLTTAQEIQEAMIKELGLPKDADKVFCIWLTSKHLQLQLKSYHLPCKLFKRWKDLLSQYTTCTFEEVCEDEPILSLQRNAFYHLRDERRLLKHQDPTLPDNYCLAIDLLYHESVFNTLRGRYPLSEEEFHSLAGLQAAVQCTENGKADADKQELISRINSFYPPHMQQSRGSMKKISKLFKHKSVDNKQVQEEFWKQYQDALSKCREPHPLKCRYLQMCWHKPYYGSVYFRGMVERSSLLPNNEQVMLAINTDCIHLMSSSLPSEILLYLTYDQFSWDFKPVDDDGEEFYSSLLLEFDSVLQDQRKVSKRIQIFSRQAPMMDAMISRSVDSLNVQEKELMRIRAEQGNTSVSVDYFFTTTEEGSSKKVGRQEPNYKEHKLKCKVVLPESSTAVSSFTLSRSKKKMSTEVKPDVASYNATSGTLATPLGVAGDSSAPVETAIEITGVVGMDEPSGGADSAELGQEETQSNMAILPQEA